MNLGTCGLIIESKNVADLYSGVFIIDTTDLAKLPSFLLLIKHYSLPGKHFLLVISLLLLPCHILSYMPYCSN